MMLLSYTMIFMTIVIYTIASPLMSNLTQSFNKRAMPPIKPGVYTAQQVEQIEQGHLDAIRLASAAVSFSKDPARFDPIFEKYFGINDKETVINVFERIVDKDDGRGNALLKDIRIVADYPNKHRSNWFFCRTIYNEAPWACLARCDPDRPELIFCKGAFKLGAIGTKSWPRAPGVSCETVYPRISTKMVVFGTVVLHEYIHWDKLVSPVIEGPFGIDSINDEAYGFWNVRRLWQADARENADSYALLAT